RCGARPLPDHGDPGRRRRIRDGEAARIDPREERRRDLAPARMPPFAAPRPARGDAGRDQAPRRARDRGARGVSRSAMAFVKAGGHRLEYEWIGLGAVDAPVIVMLHQGLGSIALWRDFPMLVHEATGLRVLAYSRWGYGRSEPVKKFPHNRDWMHRGAKVELPALLKVL